MIGRSSTFRPHPGRVIGIYSSCCLHAIIFSRVALVPPFNSCDNATRVSVKALPVQCLTLCLLRGMNGVTHSYCYSGDHPTRGKRSSVLKKRISGRLGMTGGKSPRHAQNLLLGKIDLFCHCCGQKYL